MPIFGDLLSVFLDVVVPVFGVVGLGYILGPRIRLEARTLSRVAFYIFVPAFVFHVVSTIDLALTGTLRMGAFVIVAHLAFVGLAWLVARFLRASRRLTAALIMVAVFGNVGNFGLALINFRLGPEGLAPATVYFVMINVVAFGLVVVCAAWARGGGMSALGSILRTPGLVAVVPAVLCAGYDVTLPAAAARMIELLAQAMIPTMLLALGLQLAEARGLHPTPTVLLATALRLVVAPALAWVLIGGFGITGLPRVAGILQCAMPVAVLVSIVAIEYDVEPGFVTSTVFYSTVLSLPTLTVLLALV